MYYLPPFQTLYNFAIACSSTELQSVMTNQPKTFEASATSGSAGARARPELSNLL